MATASRLGRSLTFTATRALLLALLAGCGDTLPEPGAERPALPAGLDDVDVIALPDTTAPPDADDTSELPDDEGDAAPDVVEGAPVIVAVTATPEMIAPGGTSALHVEASDPEGEALTVAWRVSAASWRLVGDDAVDVELLAPDFAGEQAEVTVRVTDPGGAFAEASVRVLTEGGDLCPLGEAHCTREAGVCLPLGSGLGDLCAVESCLALKVADAETPDGAYWVRDASGAARQVGCDMTTAGGGWTALVEYRRSDSESCPGDWVVGSAPDVCARGTDADASIRTARFDSGGLAWAELRGLATGLQSGSTDGFTGGTDLEGHYVDGLSLTLGEAPRTHLWTWVVGQDYPSVGGYSCPCRGIAARPAPPFAEGHYACEAASNVPSAYGVWFPDDPLWSGVGINGVDCDLRGEPSWIERHLDAPTTAPLDLRIMADQAASNEDIGLTAVALYVREAERCNGLDDDHDGLVDEPGCGPDNPARSCVQVRDESGFAGSGRYWLQPRPEAAPIAVHCEMSRAGGGWALAAVCRPHDPRCFDTGAVGTPSSPLIALSAKLDDADIRALLTAGSRETLAHWRADDGAGGGNGLAGVVLDTLDDPSVWQSAPCMTPAGATHSVRSATADTRTPDWDQLLADALAAPTTPLTLDPGPCACPMGGWSNVTADACGGAGGWGTVCENGPSSFHNCGDAENRAEVVLWVR